MYANGTGIQMSMDLHALMPYATLWSNIHLGKGERWLGGGWKVVGGWLGDGDNGDG